jgi:hypothetical protein
MIAQRLQHETTILETFFARKYQFVNLNSPLELLDVGVKTQSGKVYRINIHLKSDYPNSLPEVFVVSPILRMKDGSIIDSYNHDMHTLHIGSDGIQICHFKSEKWNPQESLYKIILKARIWLEAYEGHLRTGKPINDYLKS